MKKLNKKGFSMVELLAVITILGILSTISIISVQRILARAKEEFYDKQRKNIVMAAQSYLQNDKSKQPKVLGQKTTLTLKELKENKYIDKVVDYSKKECHPTNTKVTIFNYDQNEDYTYTAYLYCPPDKHEEENKFASPSISIELDKAKAKAKVTVKATEVDSDALVFSYSYKIYVKEKINNTEKYIEKQSIKTKMVTNPKHEHTFNIDIAKYLPGEIKVEVTATNNKGESKTASKIGEFADKEKPKCIYLNSKDQNKFKDVNATNESKLLAFENKATKEVTVGCLDGEGGSGCVHDTYTKRFNADIRKGNIRIYDKSGNYNDCKVDVYIDQKAPDITIDKKEPPKNPDPDKPNTKEYTYEVDWTNKDVCFNYKASDGGDIESVTWELNKKGLSQCNNSKGINDLSIVKEDTKTFTKTNATNNVEGRICIKEEGYRIGKLTIKDFSGKTTIVKVTAKIDKTAPTQPTTVSMFKWQNNNSRPSSQSGLSSYSNNTWSNKKVYTKASGSTDKISCIKEYQHQTTGTTGNKTETGDTKHIETEGISTIKYRTCDYAGNCSPYTPERTIKLDWTAPNVPTVTLKKWNNNSSRPTTSSGLQNYGNNTWSNRYVFTEPSGSSDRTSGGVYYQVTTTGKTSNLTNQKVSYRNIEAQGESYIKYRACDNAGNCSDYSPTYTIKVDTVAPSCGTKYGQSTIWTSYNRTISQYCDDSTSGCVQNPYSKTFDTTTKTYTFTIKDNAGNTNTCGVNAYVDKTPPSCGSVSGQSRSWTRGERTISVGCSDSDSGCLESRTSRYFNWSTWTENITISDKVGNRRDCPVDVYIDKEKPYTPTTTTSGHENCYIDNDTCSAQFNYPYFEFGDKYCTYRINKPGWTTYFLYQEVLMGDKHSGVDHYEVTFTCDGRGANYYPNWIRTENINLLYSGSGASHCFNRIRVVDRVGNISDVLSYDQYIRRY